MREGVWEKESLMHGLVAGRGVRPDSTADSLTTDAHHDDSTAAVGRQERAQTDNTAKSERMQQTAQRDSTAAEIILGGQWKLGWTHR